MQSNTEYEVEIPDFNLTEADYELLASLFAPIVLGKEERSETCNHT